MERRGQPAAVRERNYRMQAEAARLRRLGHSWEDVAAGAGYSNKSNAHHGVKALLREHQSLAYDEIALYRQESLDRLTALLKVAMEKALAGDEKMMHQARMIISQIDDLTGAKAPVQLQIGESDVDRLLRDALEEFRRRAGGDNPEAGATAADQAADG